MERSQLDAQIVDVDAPQTVDVDGKVSTRSSLTHVTVEALICAQDWIRDTPIDIQFKNMMTLYMEETREKLVPIQTEELGCGKGSCMDEDFT
uniref:HAT C-terminal dimerisation domain-containing protein n=1 Tax=Lactuca sativa TaxID=4236 RepID=A0A9R1VA91_LACSA|nr:hypothetical protein LSAT_V11C600330950 [Lactuca sativa]